MEVCRVQPFNYAKNGYETSHMYLREKHALHILQKQGSNILYHDTLDTKIDIEYVL